jgi:hypothetical protein
MVKKKTKSAWFKRRRGNLKSEWGFIPITWRGYVALLLLVGINVFSAQYFMLCDMILDSWLSFGIVFLLSLFVFIMIAKRRTEGVKRGK